MADTANTEVIAQWRERQRNLSAEQELQDTVVSAIWHAANRSLGAMQIATLCGNDCCIPGETAPAFDLDTWKAQKADGDLQKRLHLEAIRLAVLVGQDPRPWVVNAKATAGASWQEIAEAVGLNSRQAAQQRFGEYVQRVTEGSAYYAQKVAK
jgi:hypothetical protein